VEVQVKQSLLRKFAIQSERDRRGGSPFLVRKGCFRQLSVNTLATRQALPPRTSDLEDGGARVRDNDYTLRWFPRTAFLGRNLAVVSGVAGCGTGNVPGFPGQAVVIRAGR
jgi:hypothetical protein